MIIIDGFIWQGVRQLNTEKLRNKSLQALYQVIRPKLKQQMHIPHQKNGFLCVCGREREREREK